MKPIEIQMRIRTLQAEINDWKKILAEKSCEDCANRQPNHGCTLAGGAVPPVEVQKVGCPAWRWDGIPFSAEEA